ncbi:MAG: DUF421 domain-containing protein [Gemmataceae bacterium]
MQRWFETDWDGIFKPEMSLPEVLIRGTLVYLSLCLLLRVILKRQAGKVSLSDLLVMALIAGVCRNPLVRDTKSVPDGMAVVGIVLLWSLALDWLSFYSPIIHKLAHPSALQLVRDGQVLKENLQRELMTENQLMCQLRQHGVKQPAEVAESWMEGSGKVSVIKKEPGPKGQLRLGALLHSYDSKEGEGVALLGNGERLVSADKMLEVLAWHQKRIAEHQHIIAELKAVLEQKPA